MHLSLSAVKAHIAAALARAESILGEEAAQVIRDISQGIEHLEERAAQNGSLWSLFVSHGGTLEHAKQLVVNMQDEADDKDTQEAQEAANAKAMQDAADAEAAQAAQDAADRSAAQAAATEQARLDAEARGAAELKAKQDAQAAADAAQAQAAADQQAREDATLADRAAAAAATGDGPDEAPKDEASAT